MKQTKCLCIAAAFIMLGATYSSAQVKIIPEAGLSIYKDGAVDGRKAMLSPRVGVSVDYFFNKQESGWGILSGLHFYQKRNTDSYGYLRLKNEKGEEIISPFQPNASNGGGGYGNINSGSSLDKDLELKSASSYFVNNRRDYLQLPVMLKYKWQMNDTYSLSLAAGTYVAVGVGGKKKTDVITYETDDNKISNRQEDSSVYDGVAYKRFETGFSSRVSFQAKRLSINLNYETNLNRRYNWTNHDNLISLTAGYTF